MATNGSEAVAQFIQIAHEVDEKATRAYTIVVMLDIDMPVMDGLEAARQIRKFEGVFGAMQRNWQPAMLVAVTGNYEAQDVARCKGSGCDFVIPKAGNLRAHLSALLRP